MSRKKYIKDKSRGVYMGIFEPDGGWQNGRNGLRRKLCKISELEHLTVEQASMELEKLYHQRTWEIKNAQLIEQQERSKAKSDKFKINIRKAATLWLDEIEKLNSARTLTSYSKTIKYYFESTSDHALEDFDRAANIRFFDYLANVARYKDKPLSLITQNYHMRQFQRFLNWCYEHEYLAKRITLKKQKKPVKDMETYDIHHLQILKAHIENCLAQETRPREILNLVNMQRAFTMATQSLLRSGALNAIKLDWIDMESRVIRIKDNPDRAFVSKGLKYPNKPINDALFAFLEKDLANRDEKEVYFLDNGQGAPWFADYSGASKYASKICKAAGLPKLKPFHWGMRATMITWLLNNGVNPNQVQQLADHKDLSTTLLYLNTRKVSQVEAVNALPVL